MWNKKLCRACGRCSAAVLLGALLMGNLMASPASADDRAMQLAERVMAALGGEEAWAETRFIQFNFFGARTHHWDRHTGAHRLEGKTRDGDHYVVLHNVNSRKGEAFLNGELLTGDSAKEWLERAYGAWINDTYWLVMPYKLRDPGVHLSHDGEEDIDGQTYDKLLLTFDRVGLTPGDRYWAYIDRESGLMRRWAYHLQGWGEDRAPTAWDWLDWKSYGDIMLSSRRVKVDDGSVQMLDDIAVFDHLPMEVFQSPQPVGE